MNDIDPRITYIELESFLSNGNPANVWFLMGPSDATKPKKDRQGTWLGPNSLYLSLPDKVLFSLNSSHEWEQVG